MRAMPGTGLPVGIGNFAKNSTTQAREPIADETTIPVAIQKTGFCTP
jgi:hypothetical protein